MTSNFRIGTTLVGLTALSALTTPVHDPRSSFQDYQEALELGDSSVRGGGRPSATWKWGWVTRDMREQLRTFCPGASARVFISTDKNDDDDAFADFEAVMIWPLKEDPQHGTRLDFTIEFRDLVEQP